MKNQIKVNKLQKLNKSIFLDLLILLYNWYDEYQEDTER